MSSKAQLGYTIQCMLCIFMCVCLCDVGVCVEYVCVLSMCVLSMCVCVC